jgi:hypothetical protein
MLPHYTPLKVAETFSSLSRRDPDVLPWRESGTQLALV